MIPRSAAPVEETAAEELQQYLRKALFTELAICKEGEFTGKAFYIGHTDYAKAAGVLGKSEENWIIRSIDGNVRVDMFGNNYEWLQLSGIAEVFPMDACDVYLSIKFAGEPYGGSPEPQEAVYLERAIIVRRYL